MADSYRDFLESKKKEVDPKGFTPTKPHKILYPFQNAIVEWSVKMGRCAVFADCGLGKTLIQLEWAKQVHGHTDMPVMIVAPLAVSVQTVREGLKMDLTVNKCRHQSDVVNGINITNYEMVHHFDPKTFSGIVLDESSILKSFSGKYRRELTELSVEIPYRLCCTATPAPNDLIEITNHAEFLGILTGKEINAMFFIQDGNTTHKWKLKGHARDDFWKWMACWSVAVRTPADLGFKSDRFVLPEMHIHEHIVTQTKAADGYLFAMPGIDLNSQRKNRKATIEDRTAKAVELVNAEPDESWLIWCDLNAESDMAKKALNAIEVKGADSTTHKENTLLGFSTGEVMRLVTKPKIAGFGMNWQNCSRVIFLGLSHSYEAFYQAVRRVWRFGQKRPVDVHIIIADTDGAIKTNIERKERQAAEIMDKIIENMKDIQIDRIIRNEMEYEESHETGDGWDLYLGDSCETIDKIPDESIGLSVFSPPFPGMYAYTNSRRDIGNCANIDVMIKQFKYLMPKILRVTQPGRMCCIHLCQIPAFKGVDGYMGVKDFRGRIIMEMEDSGWIYYGEACIDKDPQLKAIRTKDRGLLFKTLSKDSSNMHMALADYLIYFRKHGDSPKPIRAGISKRYDNMDGWISSEDWIEWAAPVWYRQTKDYPGGIRETDVLNVRCARDSKDEKHLCPLQLGVIRRAVLLWSNPGDTVFSPFAGIGSEGYVALKEDRKFIGIELKKSYFTTAVNNLNSVKQGQLF